MRLVLASVGQRPPAWAETAYETVDVRHGGPVALAVVDAATRLTATVGRRRRS